MRGGLLGVGVARGRREGRRSGRVGVPCGENCLVGNGSGVSCGGRCSKGSDLGWQRDGGLGCCFLLVWRASWQLLVGCSWWWLFWQLFVSFVALVLLVLFGFVGLAFYLFSLFAVWYCFLWHFPFYKIRRIEVGLPRGSSFKDIWQITFKKGYRRIMSQVNQPIEKEIYRKENCPKKQYQTAKSEYK